MKMQANLLAMCVFVCVAYAAAVSDCNIDKTGLPNDACAFDLRMKDAHPSKPDQYFCSGYSVSQDIFGVKDKSLAEGYIVRFEPLADADTAHHILVYGCSSPLRQTGNWQCGSVCGGGKEQILFAWAKNAPPLSLPKDVGRHIGAAAEIDSIVVQIHYAKVLQKADNLTGIRIIMTQQRQQFIAGIYLLLAYDITIPANTPKKHADISCRFNWADSIVPFGYRTHAHSLGRVISGYRVNGQKYEMIGKGNPQWPQAFYPVDHYMKIEPGDILAARCTFNSTGRHRTTQIGSTSADEMCNFYIMYYTNSTSAGSRGFDTCAGNNLRAVFDNIPADSDTPLPSNPDLEDEATGHHHHHAMTGGQDPEVDTEAPPTDDIAGPSNSVNVVDIGADSDSQSASPLRSDLDLKFVSEVGNFKLGQVGGVAVSKDGELYIFHRGSRIWNSQSFDAYNTYQLKSLPVASDAIIILNKDGTLKRSFGKDRYYLPHGLSLDQNENIWLTDVALHQVFRIPKGGTEPDLTLGIQFEPGSDDEHFCKPADVAVLATGEFFVADGYCNSRVMKYDANGYLLKQWGTPSSYRGDDGFPPPSTFVLPHGLTLAEDKGLLCVADRENGRIQCFDFEGKFVRQMHPKQFGSALYALEYCPKHGGILFAVNGPKFGSKDPDTQGFTLDINTGGLLSTWNIPGKGLNHPHDVTVDTERHLVYVGELTPSKVWKFEMSKALYSANKTKEENPKPVAITDGKNIVQPVSVSTNIGKSADTVVKTLSTDTSMIDVVTSAPSKDVVNTGVSHSVVDIIDIVNVDVQDSRLDMTVEEPEDYAPSLIIGMLLVVPVLLLIVITVLIRLYHTGYFSQCRKRSGGNKAKFNLGNLLNPHKGFDRLSTEDDDHDLENAMDDSDNEEFSIVRKA